MNAILVFDPSNDLLFVKSNKIFRSRLLGYAKSNGLLVGHQHQHQFPASSLETSSSHCCCCKSLDCGCSNGGVEKCSRKCWRKAPDNAAAASHEVDDDQQQAEQQQQQQQQPHERLQEAPPPRPLVAGQQMPNASSAERGRRFDSVARQNHAAARDKVSPSSFTRATSGAVDDWRRDSDSAGRRPDRHANPTKRSSSSSSSSCSSSCSSSSEAADHFLAGDLLKANGEPITGGQLRPKPRRARLADERRQQQWATIDDTSKCYLEILMLLLTPYVASLRLSNNLQLCSAHERRQWSNTPSARPAGQSSRNNNMTQSQQRAAGIPASLSVVRMNDRDRNKCQQDDHHHHHQEEEEDDELLAKFMRSISIDHECERLLVGGHARGVTAAASQNRVGGHQRHFIDEQEEDGDCNSCGQHPGAWTRADKDKWPPGQDPSAPDKNSTTPCATECRFSALKMPIECLENCQVVYCELGEFIFIYMQEFQQVSSFKMRLLQKRIDMFARLALFLFGPALSSLREPATGDLTTRLAELEATNHQRHHPSQGLILRQVFECWFQHQFEPELLLEAHERLIVGSQIELLCRETLRQISIELRSSETNKETPPVCRGTGETHQHAMLFSDLKLISQYSCLNAGQLAQDDLMLVIILLKTFIEHHEHRMPDQSMEANSNDGPRGSQRRKSEKFGRKHSKNDVHHHQTQGNSTNLYESYYASNRHTSQISSSAHHHHHHHHQFDATGLGRQARRRQAPSTLSSTLLNKKQKLPHRFPVFLSSSTHAKRPELSSQAPHIISFLKLNQGITLVLLSECSASSFLSLQLSRINRLLLEFVRQSALQAVSSEQDEQELSRTRTKVAAQRTRTPSGGGSRVCLKLAQVTRVNDCISAIKSYFFGLSPACELLSGPDQQQQQQQTISPSQPSSSNNNNNHHHEDDTQKGHRDKISGRQLQWSLLDKFKASNKTQVSSEETCSLEQQQQLDDSANGYDADELVRQQQQQQKRSQNVAGQKSGMRQGPARSSTGFRRLFDVLDSDKRRLCCHLVRRLHELSANNIHTYMRQTFALQVDEHKREALLGSVCAIVRRAFASFVLEPQLAKLDHHSLQLLDHSAGHSRWDLADRYPGASLVYLRHMSNLHDRIKLMARERLSDYLDYLAIKAQCNVTLGAPLTHDMQAISSFIYIDRSRQQMLVSPLISRSMSRMSERELVEGDFKAAIERQLRLLLGSSGARSLVGGSGSTSSSSQDESSLATSCESLSSSYSSNHQHLSLEPIINDFGPSLGDPNEETRPGSMNLPKRPTQKRHPFAGELHNNTNTNNNPTSRPLGGTGQRLFLATSQDLLSPGSSSSMATHASGSQASSSSPFLAANSSNYNSKDQKAISELNLSRTQAAGRKGQQQHQQQPRDSSHLVDNHQVAGGLRETDLMETKSVDENLVKGFVAFIYNRLASGQAGSITTNNTSTGHDLSYFLWFKRNSDGRVLRPTRECRRATSASLATNYKSLPSVLCCDFFAQLTHSLAGCSVQNPRQTKRDRSGGCEPSSSSSNSSTSLSSLSSSLSSSSFSVADLRAHHSRRSKARGSKRRLVEVFCRMRELDARSGRDLTRRQLSRVREEEEQEEDEGSEEEEDHGELEFNPSDQLRGTIKISSKRVSPPDTEARDFGSFLNIQEASGSPQRRAKKGRQGGGEGKETSSEPEQQQEPESGLSCYEIFCIHRSDLLVHKAQVTFEAQRLARRLGQLLAGPDEPGSVWETNKPTT